MDRALTQWLLTGDPGVAWQVERDLLRAPPEVWQATRARVALEGQGAALLAAQGADGAWAGGAFMPAGYDWATRQPGEQPWTATGWVLGELRLLGLDPEGAPARAMLARLGAGPVWDHADEPFWQGEVEECINGRLLAAGAWFGRDMDALAARLIADRQDEGGWNCYRHEGSCRSSFDSTINVLEGLLAWEVAGGTTPGLRRARAAGEAWLMQRGLFRRMTTGQAAAPDYLRLRHPNRWRHDILRGLDHLRAAGLHDGTPPDPRLAGAVAILRDKRRADGTWAADDVLRGASWWPPEPVGAPSRWITLRALRVLDWWDRAA